MLRGDDEQDAGFGRERGEEGGPEDVGQVGGGVLLGGVAGPGGAMVDEVLGLDRGEGADDRCCGL